MKVREVNINEIKVADRFRQDLGDVEELAESISTKGLIQPISIDEDYNLLAGGRRLEAFRSLGKTKISAVIRKVEGPLDAREIELFENIHRKDMTWQEETKLLSEIHALMLEKYGKDWGVRRTAQLISRSKSSVGNAVSLENAMQVIPGLADLPTADKARRKLKRILEDASIAKALQEAKTSGEQNITIYADNHYIIGDALAGLEKIHAGTRHFAEVDPPYAIDLKRHRGESSQDMGSYTEISAREYPDFIKRSATLVYNSLYENSFCVWWYGPTWHHEVNSILKAVGFQVDDIPAIWNKIDTGTISGNPNTHLARGYEPFFVCRKGSPMIRQKNRVNVFSYQGVPPQNRIHATERPIELMREILRTFAYPKAKVIVPFLGSGNTLIACYHEGMIGMGWDLSQEHKDGFITRVHKQFDAGFAESL